MAEHEAVAAATTRAGVAEHRTVAAAADAVDATQPSAPVLDTDAALQLIAFDDRGLVPAVIQQWNTGEVLMMGWMNAEAFRRTMSEGRVTFWSRSRQEYWRKGDTSGHRQWVRSAALDCDSDVLLVQVDQVGPACHTGARSCFDTHPLKPVVGSEPAGVGSEPAGVGSEPAGVGSEPAGVDRVGGDR